MANSGRLAMTRNNEGVVIEAHQLLLNGCDDFRLRAAPQIGAADTFSEEGVPGEQDVAIVNEMKTGAAGCMARRMNHSNLDPLAGNRIAVLNEVLDRASFWHRHSNPLGLHVELFK